MQYDIVFNNMFNAIPFPTRELPQSLKNPFYKIVWVSEFDLNPLALSEPTVELLLAPYLETEINPQTVNTKRAFDNKAILTVRVGVGQLPALPLGAFIRDRRVVAIPDYGPETYDLVIDDEHTSIIRADATYSEGGSHVPYIPPLYYPLPDKALSTKCMVVEREVTDDTQVSRVIFPCPVLLTTYFGTSTALIKEVVNGGMAIGGNRIFDPAQTGFDADGTAYIRLRRDMVDGDAGGVARFALVLERCAEVQYINESIRLNGHNGEGYVPVVRPPFRGVTTMVLHGKRIKSGSRWHFLVFRIDDCTGPYPYERLRYARDNDGRGDGTKDRSRPEAYKNDNKSVRHSSHKSEELEVRSDDEPSLERIETNIKLTGVRFSSMPEDIEKVEKIECRFRAADSTTYVEDGETKGLSTADGDHGNTELDRLRISRGLEEAREDLSDRLATFLRVLDEMRRQAAPYLNYALVMVGTPSASNAENLNISVFPEKLRGKTLSWSFLPGPPKTRRRVIVAEVKYHHHYFYLFEAEKRPKVGETEESITTLIVHYKEGAQLANRLLAHILFHGADKNGIWLNGWRWPELLREKLDHRSVIVERFAERVIEYFDKHVKITKEEPQLPPPTELSNVAAEGLTA